jgi:hypothetical protein
VCRKYIYFILCYIPLCTTTKITTDEINGHIRDGGWRPVVALLTMSWWLLPLCRAAAPHIHPASSGSQRWWGVLSLSSTLVGPPLPTHQPSSLRAVAHSGGVWCHGRRRLPLVPVVVLFCVGGAGAGAIGVGVGLVVVVVVVVSSPPRLPSCSSSLRR